MDATVQIEAAIRRTEDGEVRIHCYSVAPEHVRGQRFWWEDGNAACDCNRHIFFEREGGHELTDEEDEALECSYGKYVVSIKNADTGEAIYDE